MTVAGISSGGGDGVSLSPSQELELSKDTAHPQANIIFGAVIDEAARRLASMA